MKLATRLVGVCAAIALAMAGFEAEAKGGRGGGGRGSGGHHSHSGSHHSHGHYGRSSFFVASTFAIWPSAYYWPDYNPAAVPVVEYWYYCQPYAAYYPYVQECPVDWQPVLPTAPSPDEFIER
jgi:hypothetical protein